MGFMDIFKKREPNNPKTEVQPQSELKPKSQPIPLIVEDDEKKVETQKVNPSPKTDTTAQATASNPYDTPAKDFSQTYSGSFKPWVSDYDDPLVFTPVKHSYKPLYEKRDVIVLAVESTAKVSAYRTEVLKLVNKIVEDNKSELFLFLRTGSENEYFDVLSYEQLKTKNLPDCLLSSDSSSDGVKLANALTHIYDFAKSYSGRFSLMTLGDKKYDISRIRIIFIGTGATDTNPVDATQASKFLKLLCDNKQIKAIKYFCAKDEDAINAATTGFPVIGHIESNFYK